MYNLTRALLLGGSSVAMSTAASFFGGFALAQPAPDNSVEQVVVTGTSIRGVAPVGSNLIVMGPADIAATGAQTVQDMLANVPALMNMGSTGQAQPGGSAFQPIIHSLGAQASTSTLTLVDGHRIPLGGTTHANADPNMLPANVIERVEVLADGSSSVYGSDAVAGVVNFITRQKFDGVQLTGQVSELSGAVDYTGGILVGKTWSDGSAIFAYTHTFEGSISNIDRPYITIAGQLARGGTNQGSFNCDPASIQPNATGNIYPSPTATTALANTPANSPCDAVRYGDLLPTTKRDNVMAKTSVDIGSSLTLSGEAVYGTRTDVQAISRGSVTATVFSAGALANPFYVNPPGVTATKQSVRWDADALLGPGAQSLTGAKDFYADFNAEYRIGDNFVVNLLALAGADTSYIDSFGVVNGSVADFALNGTDNSGGSLTYVVPAVNMVLPSQTLTAANALDVWDPASSNKTSAAVISKLTDNANIKAQDTATEQLRLSTNGTLFDMPAGPLKVAAGVELLRLQQDPRTQTANNTGPATVESSTNQWFFHRNVASFYAEADIPIVSESMGIPLVQRFELDISGRYDSYSDVGNTANPKFAINWQVIDALKLRGNISTSFVAPTLDTIGQSHPGYAYGTSASTTYGSVTNNVNVPVSIYPTVTLMGIAGCTSASVTCNISSLQGINATLDNPNNKPQRGHTWSVGFDFSPDFLPGFTAQMTLWNNSFAGAVTAPQIGFIVNNASLSSLMTFYPGGATQAQIGAITNPLTPTSALPAVTQYIQLSENSNWLNLFVQGIDASASYTIDTDYGNFRPGVALTQFLKFDQSYGTGPTYSVLNTSGANTAFPSVATQMRASLGWSLEQFEADIFVNYTGAYRNWSSKSQNPVTVNAFGAPSGGGDHVNANTTVDVHLAYDFTGGMFGDNEISLTERNVFNRAPPFLNASGYDTYVASVLGRVTTVALKAKW